MKADEKELTDELRPEYDLDLLEVRRLGPQRKHFGHLTVRLEPDVAEAFPTAEAVNEALRFLLRITRDNQSTMPGSRNGA
jgi:hypothetical protein